MGVHDDGTIRIRQSGLRDRARLSDCHVLVSMLWPHSNGRHVELVVTGVTGEVWGVGASSGI